MEEGAAEKLLGTGKHEQDGEEDDEDDDDVMLHHANPYIIMPLLVHYLHRIHSA